MASPNAVAKKINSGNIPTFPGRSGPIKKLETIKKEKGMTVTKKIDSNNLFLKETFLGGGGKKFMLFLFPKIQIKDLNLEQRIHAKILTLTSNSFFCWLIY
jgi:hypothetical protein